MIIPYYVKNVYVVNQMYIYDRGIAKLVKTLTNKKTIAQSDIEALTALTGCAWVQVFAPTK
jgi:hypothetical protein